MFAGARYAAVASTEPNCSRVRVDRLSRSRNAATAARRSLVSVAENSLRRGEARWSDEGAFGFKNTSADLCAGGDGARFGVDMGDSRDEFVALADGAIARMRMLESILDDLYGARTLLSDSVVDHVALWGSPHYRLAAFGQRPHRRLGPRPHAGAHPP